MGQFLLVAWKKKKKSHWNETKKLFVIRCDDEDRRGRGDEDAMMASRYRLARER